MCSCVCLSVCFFFSHSRKGLKAKRKAKHKKKGKIASLTVKAKTPLMRTIHKVRLPRSHLQLNFFFPSVAICLRLFRSLYFSGLFLYYLCAHRYRVCVFACVLFFRHHRCCRRYFSAVGHWF